MTRRERVLAFDTATELCSVALLVGDPPGGDAVLATDEALGRGASEHILTMIDTLLRRAGIALGELDAIGFGRGPGGFTGVRLATSVAQGLAFGASLPVVPVSDLQALAEHALGLEPLATHALVCNDARMREVYWALYAREGGASGASLVGHEHVGPADSVRLDAAAGSSIVGAGRGFAVYPGLAERLGPQCRAVHDALLPHAREVAVIAAREWRAGRAVSAAAALPVYLRDDVAVPTS
jgi:tRNA threonylcarbamoyladenosine biosynthesis protein TsaB